MFVLIHVLVAIHKEKKIAIEYDSLGTLPDYVSYFNNDNDMTTEVTWITRMVMINNDINFLLLFAFN